MSGSASELIDDRRAQLDGDLPMRYRLAPTTILVLIVIAAETSIATVVATAVATILGYAILNTILHGPRP